MLSVPARGGLSAKGGPACVVVRYGFVASPARCYHPSGPNGSLRGPPSQTPSLYSRPSLPSLPTKVCYVQVRCYVRAHTAKTMLAHFKRKPAEVSTETEPEKGSIYGWIWFGLCVLVFVIFVFCILREKVSRKTLGSVPEEVQNSDMQLNKTHEYRILREVHRKITRQSNEYMNNLSTTIDAIVGDDEKLKNLGIDKELWPFIKQSWSNKDPHFLGRLDLYVDFEEGEKSIVMMDYNAKKPSFLRESVSIQSDQSQQLEKKLEEQFQSLYNTAIMKTTRVDEDTLPLPTPGQTDNEVHPQLHFVVLTEDPEEMWNANYLAERARRGGFDSVVLKGTQIFWNGHNFVDSRSAVIERIWNPEPWKILKQVKARDMEVAYSATKWVEPMWKAILEKEAILPYLWEKNYFKDAYLPSYFSNEKFIQNKTPYVEIAPNRQRHQIIVYKEDNTVDTTYSVPTPSPSRFPLYNEYIIPPSADSDTKYMAYTWIVGNITQFVGFQEDKNPYFGPNRVAVQTTLIADCVPRGILPIFRPFRYARRGSSAAAAARSRTRPRASTATSRPIFGTKAGGSS